MDVLWAPSGLTPHAAKVYDLAATPSKGVYIALLAIGSIIFPFVRLNPSRRLIVKAAGGTLALGLAVTGVLVALRHVIGIVLNQPAPSFLLLALLGGAMAVAGTTSVFINAGVARGVARPWPPPAMGMVVMIVCWSLDHGDHLRRHLPAGPVRGLGHQLLGDAEGTSWNTDLPHPD